MSQASKSTLNLVLKALLPYSRENLKLAYHPSKFFSDLERTSKKSPNTFRSTMSRAIQQGYVERIDGVPVLTPKGKVKIKPFKPTALDKNAFLLITFDIPEVSAAKRRLLRHFLKLHDFRLVQKSVWATRYDYRELLMSYVDELGVEGYVHIYESVRIN